MYKINNNNKGSPVHIRAGFDDIQSFTKPQGPTTYNDLQYDTYDENIKITTKCFCLGIIGWK